MTEKRATDEELAEEARRWDEREVTPAGWEDAPDAVPRAKASEAISLRLPKPLLAIVKEFARREGMGYQVLIKRWLDDRVRQERERRGPASPQRRAIEVHRDNLPPLVSTTTSFDVKDVNLLSDKAVGELKQAIAAHMAENQQLRNRLAALAPTKVGDAPARS